MRSHEEQQMQLHRARTKLISFKKMAMHIMAACKPMAKQDFDILLECARVSEDFHDSLTLHEMVTTLGVEYEH